MLKCTIKERNHPSREQQQKLQEYYARVLHFARGQTREKYLVTNQSPCTSKRRKQSNRQRHARINLHGEHPMIRAPRSASPKRCTQNHKAGVSENAHERSKNQNQLKAWRKPESIPNPSATKLTVDPNPMFSRPRVYIQTLSTSGWFRVRGPNQGQGPRTRPPRQSFSVDAPVSLERKSTWRWSYSVLNTIWRKSLRFLQAQGYCSGGVSRGAQDRRISVINRGGRLILHAGLADLGM